MHEGHPSEYGWRALHAIIAVTAGVYIMENDMFVTYVHTSCS